MSSAIAIARYLLAAHVRSRAFVAPGAATAVGVVTIYSVEPNPVLSTTGSVATLLFFTQAWLGLTLLNAHAPADRWTLTAGAGHWPLTCGRHLAAAVMALATSVCAVLYPLAAGRFDHAPSAYELTLCLVACGMASLAGTALGALFVPPLVRNRAIATLGLAACALLTVPLGHPAISIAQALDTTDGAAVPLRLAPDLTETAAFVVAVVLVTGTMWRRRD
jgi:hypothetical protein